MNEKLQKNDDFATQRLQFISTAKLPQGFKMPIQRHQRPKKQIIPV